MALTTGRLVAWMNAATGSEMGPIAATPNSDALELLQLCIDAAITSVGQEYDIASQVIDLDPLTYTHDVELALLIEAASHWQARNAPFGIAGFGDLGAVRVGARDPRVRALLSPYWVPNISGPYVAE